MWVCFWVLYSVLLFLEDFIFKERGREGEREGEKHQCVVTSHMPPTGDLAQNPGMCPDWESNHWPFGSRVDAQSTEPHQPGLYFGLLISMSIFPPIPHSLDYSSFIFFQNCFSSCSSSAFPYELENNLVYIYKFFFLGLESNCIKLLAYPFWDNWHLSCVGSSSPNMLRVFSYLEIL